MRHSIENNVLTIYLEGQITSSNAEDFSNAMAALVAETQPDSVVLDASDLEFISSAGLRAIMRLIKAVQEVSVIDASPDVYDVFDMTGFTQVLDVRQAR
jgi:anti-anti-sigma factor